jgi:hypothetical protein
MIVLYSFPWRMSALLPVVVLTLVSIPVAHAAENLVGNGGAEAVDRSGKVTGWAVRNRSGIVAVTADIDDKTEGRQAARIQPQGGEAANFSMQIGQVAVPRQPRDTTYLFSADVKLDAPAGEKATAVFRLGIDDKTEAVKVPVKAGWQTLEQVFTLKANRPFTRFDLSGDLTPKAALHVDNVSIVAFEGAPDTAASTAWLEQEDTDGDGAAEIIVTTASYRMVVSPVRGGSILSFRVKPSAEELLIPDATRGGGLLGDIVDGSAFGGEWQGPWQVEVRAEADKATIELKRQAPSAQLTLIKTLHVEQSSPIIRVTVRAANAGRETGMLKYAVHNRVASVEHPTTYYMPSYRGVEAGEFQYHAGGQSQTQAAQYPPQGWLAALVSGGPGLAVRMTRGDPQLLYSYRKNKVATLEWAYGQMSLVGEPPAIEFDLMAIHGLPRVDGMLGPLAAALDTPATPHPPGEIRGRLVVSGEPGLHTLELSWRRLPETDWNHLSSQTVRIPQDPGEVVAIPFRLPAGGPGTFVVRARATAGNRELGVVDRGFVVGEPSGQFRLNATLQDVDFLGPTHRDGAIPLRPDEPLVIRKLLPTDCRLVRGFASAPVDGRTDTRHAAGGIAEWSRHGLPAVNYGAFNGGNGLHVTLTDGPIDALQIRGGWSGRVFTDAGGLMPPAASQPPLLHVQSRLGIARARFTAPVSARKISFFYDEMSEDPLADMSFLQVRSQTGEADFGNSRPPPVTFSGGRWEEPQGLLQDVMVRRFKVASRILRLAAGEDSGGSFAKGEVVHMITPTLDSQTGVIGVTLDLTVAEVEPGALLTIRVQDVLDPLRENMGVDFVVPGPGRYRVTLDTPDQVFLPPADQWAAPPRLDGTLAPPPAVWVSMACDAPLQLAAAAVTIHQSPREEALAEAGRWRTFLLRGMFATMSEPRPWMLLQDGTPIRQQIATARPLKAYRESLLELLTHLEVTRLLLPADELIQQYHDWVYQNVDRRRPQPPPVVPSEPGVPRWATLLRENWRLLRETAAWWLDNRMTPDGQFGGGLNDDTDLFQTWQCFPMIEASPLGERLKAASARLTDTLLAHTLEEGINRRSLDVLHAYEEGVNQLALNAWWFHGDPLHFERCMASARSALRLMVELPDGRVHMGAPEVGIHEARHGFERLGSSERFARLFLHPLYEVALFNRNPTVIEKMIRWGRTWAAYQKPGAFVDQVSITTGKPAQTFPDQRGPVDEWTAIWQVTGDRRWLEPLIMGMKPGSHWGFAATYGDLPQACVAWPAEQQRLMQQEFEAAGYAGLRLTGNRAGLEQSLEQSLAWSSRFRDMQTTAEQKTDRVLNYKASPVCAAYLGAAPNRNRWVRFNAVSYEGFDSDTFAPLVWEAGPDRLRVALFNFRNKPFTGRLRLWQLDHGRYQVRQGRDADDDGQIDTADAGMEQSLRRHDAIEVMLSPRCVTVVEIRQVQKLDDLLVRADLALSPALVELDGQTVRGTAHNIGSRTAEAVIAVFDDRGHEVLRQRLGDIDAPVDLFPRRLSFELPLPKPARSGWTVRLDPDDTVPEILETNNSVALAPAAQ